jgi:hypothetical protein
VSTSDSTAGYPALTLCGRSYSDPADGFRDNKDSILRDLVKPHLTMGLDACRGTDVGSVAVRMRL